MPPSSMSTAVKSHQAFFLAARTARAAGLVPPPRHLAALLQGRPFDFTHTRRAAPSDSGGSVPGRPACVSVRAPGPNDRLSVWNLPRSHAPTTVYASSVRHAISKSSPIERTVPSQDHPAAQRRLSPTSLTPPQRRRPRLLTLRSASVAFATSHALDQRGRSLGVPPRRRTHRQPPVLLLGPRRQLPLLDVTPQRD